MSELTLGTAKARLEDAVALLRAGDDDEALAQLAQLIEDPAGRYDALGHRAFYWMNKAQYEPALADYRLMQTICDHDPTVKLYMGSIYARLGNHASALAHAMKALSLDPGLCAAGKLIVSSQEALGHAEFRRPAPLSDAQVPATPINWVIAALERDSSSYPGSVLPETGRMLYQLTRLLRPTTVVEVGTNIGYSALCIAQALEENGFGHLHSFDLFPEIPNYNSPVAGAVTDTYQVCSVHLQRANLHHRVTLHKGESSKGIRDTFGARDPDVQLCFIDGDHRIAGTLKDWNVLASILAPEGIIAVHDTNLDTGWLEPKYLLEKLRSDSEQAFAAINLKTADGCGLALVQKRGDAVPGDWWPSITELIAEHLHLRKHAHHFTWLGLRGFVRGIFRL